MNTALPKPYYKISEVNADTESQIISEVRNKKQEAFSYLYDKYSTVLYTIIYRSMNSKTASEDILQDVFVKIWNKFSQYDESKGSIYTWMVTITKNQLLDVVRSKGYKQDLKNDISTKDRRTQCECEFLKFDSLNVYSFLKQLSPNEIKLINLAYYQGLTQKEISINMGIPLGTVKTNIRAAITKLREVIKD